MEKLGIQQTKELVDLLLTLNKIGHDMAADKKFDLADLAQIMQLMPVLVPAIEGVDKLPAELADLDSAEAAELVAHVATKLVTGDENATKIVLAALKTALGAAELGLAIKAAVEAK